MTQYHVQHMTTADYHNFMCGYNDYSCATEVVEAESAAAAAEIVQAQFPTHVVNKDYVRSTEEIEAEDAHYAELRRIEVEKEAARKAKAKAREAEKAAEAGMTVEEYKKKKAKEAKIRAAKREVERLERELEEAKKYLARLEG